MEIMFDPAFRKTLFSTFFNLEAKKSLISQLHSLNISMKKEAIEIALVRITDLVHFSQGIKSCSCFKPTSVSIRSFSQLLPIDELNNFFPEIQWLFGAVFHSKDFTETS